eukprot:CAMPEP_0113663438 /NCGR_PEP_ID=MMETSP0038_2-20120614/1142_1 /TAXON_ID=2898 /ORGANISM="Cryptomonas paramecium" /LENGTH=142 /DNA_ID=CAMNT_0000578465 /DNA_START=87 /DNA_END=511 /DNA_ORIENTATION=- /assembly_acc=CAM_ASM_000170
MNFDSIYDSFFWTGNQAKSASSPNAKQTTRQSYNSPVHSQDIFYAQNQSNGTPRRTVWIPELSGVPSSPSTHQNGASKFGSHTPHPPVRNEQAGVPERTPFNAFIPELADHELPFHFLSPRGPQQAPPWQPSSTNIFSWSTA